LPHIDDFKDTLKTGISVGVCLYCLDAFCDRVKREWWIRAGFWCWIICFEFLRHGDRFLHTPAPLSQRGGIIIQYKLIAEKDKLFFVR
jgi:hypothetical protein